MAPPTTAQTGAWQQAAQPKAIEPRLYNLIADNESLLTNILKTSRLELEQVARTYSDPVQFEQILRALINRGFVVTDQYSDPLSQFKQNINTAFEIGLNKGQSAPSAVMSIIQTTLTDSVMNYVTKMDTDLKQQLGKILADGYANKVMPNEIVKQMTNKVGISESRAGKIARTETMRASQTGSWAQNKAEGAKYFIVDHRAAACKRCISLFRNRIFSIDETKYIPPIHPNCACVAIFFNNKADAQKYLAKVRKRNDLEADLLKNQGHSLPKDGTGPNATGKEQARIINQINGTSKTKIKTTTSTQKLPSSNSTATKTPTQVETNLGTFNPGVYKLVSSSRDVKTMSGVKVGGGVRLKEGTFTRYNYYDGQDNIAILFKKGLPKKFQNPGDILNVYKKMSPTLKGEVNRIIATTGSGRGLGYHVDHQLTKDDIYIAPKAIGNDPDKLAHTIIHESGHAYDYSFIPYRSQGKLIKPERPFRWIDSMKADKELGKEVYVTNYAHKGINEDFAESVALYHADPKQFKIDFPSRYETLKKVM